MFDVRKQLGYKPTIYLDDGHGIETPGKRTPKMADGSVIRENQFNAAVVAKAKAKFESCGFRVVLTAPEVEDVPLKTRIIRANEDYLMQQKVYPDVDKSKLGLFFSVHFNALDGRFGTNEGGVETHFYKTSKNGKALAACVQKHVALGTPQRNRGIKGTNLYVNRKTYMPANLIEFGFMDVEREAHLMLNDAYQDESAEELFRGACEYLDVVILEDLFKDPAAEEELKTLRAKVKRYEDVITVIHGVTETAII